mgnify:FL=1
MTKFDVLYYGMLLGIAMITIDYYFISGGLY